jgi:hypothetical protein
MGLSDKSVRELLQIDQAYLQNLGWIQIHGAIEGARKRLLKFPVLDPGFRDFEACSRNPPELP